MFTDNACDLGLGDNGSGVCVGTLPPNFIYGSQQSGTRHILGTSANYPWLDFAMKQQRFGIQSDQAMNWISIFGTHNSFSNFQDGTFSNFNGDQGYSITDQLDAGARYIRIDPVSFGVTAPTSADTSELRVCHQSADSTAGTQLECNQLSYGRLFAYALAEVRLWLQKNPEEVLVMRMDRVRDADRSAIDAAIAQELEGQGISVLLPSYSVLPSNMFPARRDPTLLGWPTMREMRSMGARIIIFSDNGTPAYAYPWSWVIPDGSTDTPHFNSRECGNEGGSFMDVRHRGFNQWAYIGEDRSLSDLASGPNLGLIDANAVTTATNCGFSITNVDFLLSPNSAPLSEGLSNPDLRREAAIWSWEDGDFGTQGPAYLRAINSRWSSKPAATSMNFACAVGQAVPGNVQNPANYSWAITRIADKWSSGQQRCLELGEELGEPATFWAPQSALENQRLATVARLQGQDVWINYSAGKLVVEAKRPDLLTSASSNLFTATILQGAPLYALWPSFELHFTGGSGGPLTATVDNGGTPLFSGISIDSLHKSITLSAASSITDGDGNVTLAPGTYIYSFFIEEALPNGSKQASSIKVALTVVARS